MKMRRGATETLVRAGDTQERVIVEDRRMMQESEDATVGGSNAVGGFTRVRGGRIFVSEKEIAAICSDGSRCSC